MDGLLVYSMIIMIILSLISTTLSIKFQYVIEPKKTHCIGEYLTENTVAIFSVKASNKEIICQVYNPANTLLYQKENQKAVKVSITATDSGNHLLCVSNKESSNVDVKFEFLSGIEAKDYSDIAKESNLKPVELSLQKLEDMIKYLIQEMSTVMKQEETDLGINDSLSSKIIIFSLITLVVMIAVGIIETLYIKKYLHSRKII